MYNPYSPFAAVVDNWADDPLLPDHPYNLLLNKKVHDLPWIISYVSGEGLYPGTGNYANISIFFKSLYTFTSDFYHDEHLEYINKHWNKVLPYILHYNDVVPDNRLDSVSQKIRDEYLKGKELNKDTYHLLIKV